MALPTASDNVFPKILISEGAEPASPPSGQAKLFVDVADGLFKWKASDGTVREIGTASSSLDAIIAASSGQDIADALAGAAAPDASNVFATMADVGGGGGGGGPVLLGTYTASASATLDLFTRNASGQSGAVIQSDYKIYELIFLGVKPATNNVEFILRMATGGGPTVDSTSGRYSWIEYRSVAGAAAAGGTGSADGIRLVASPDNMSNAAQLPLHATARLYVPNDGTIYPAVEFVGGRQTGGGSQERSDVDGLYTQTTSITALQFVMSSGNIASGSIFIYGLA